MTVKLRRVCGMLLLICILTGCGNIGETELDNFEARVEKLLADQETEILLTDGYPHKIRLGIVHDEGEPGEVYLELDGIKRSIETAGQVGSAFVLYKGSGRVFLLLDVEREPECYSTMVFEFAHGRLVQTAATDACLRIDPDSVTTDSVILVHEDDTLQKYKITSEGELEE